MAGRNYSRKESPALSDLPLIWDAANADWRLSTIQSIKDLVLADRPSAEAPLVELEAVFVTQNPVLELGQLGIALDQNYFKIGDGVLAWNSITPRYEADTYLGTAAARDHGTAADQVPLNSDLGTAAVADVQTSPTDTTADRLMKVEAFGLGGQAVPPSSGISIDDNTLANGIYRWSSVTPGTTPESVADGTWIQLRREDGVRAHQIAMIQSTARLFFRARGGTAWSAWVELYHSSNYPSDTAWTTPPSLSNGWTGTLRYIKRAGWVVGTGNVNGTAKSTDVVFTLGGGYQPGVEYYDTANDSGTIRNVTITTGGAITIPGTSASVFFSFAYPVIT